MKLKLRLVSAAAPAAAPQLQQPPSVPAPLRPTLKLPQPAAQQRPAPVLAATRYDWLRLAATHRGKATQLAVMLSCLAAEQGTSTVRPTRTALQRFGVSRDAAYDALRKLEAAGLVHVWRLPGRVPRVALVEPGTDQALRLT